MIHDLISILQYKEIDFSFAYIVKYKICPGEVIWKGWKGVEDVEGLINNNNIWGYFSPSDDVGI